MFNFRTDLANERREIYRVANKLEDDKKRRRKNR